MTRRFRHAWEQLRGSLWFVPSLCVVAAIGLAFVMVALDRGVGSELSVKVPLVFEAGPEGARQVLGTIAGSVLTVAGVAFSFTILAFSLASSQYSPRILSNFMDDRTNQTVLGVLLGSFVYCLLVLRTVRLEGNSVVDSTFVPSLSVTVALLLALLDLGLFILYLHHIAVSVTAHDIINRVGQAAVQTVERTFLEEPRRGPTGSEANIVGREVGQTSGTVELRASGGGYIQDINADAMFKLAEQYGLRVEVKRRVGDFMTVGKLLALVSSHRSLEDDMRDRLRGAFSMGARRTRESDVLFGVLQLSDVAVRALSPGVNDPTTAVMCLDQIERVLVAAATREAPRTVYCNSEGVPLVTLRDAGFGALADHAFTGIRHYGAGDVAVASRMLEVIASIAELTSNQEYRLVLRGHARALIEAAGSALKTKADRLLLDQKIAALSADSPVSAWVLPLLGTRLA